MGWIIRARPPVFDPDLDAAQKRLARLEAAERRKELALRLAARRPPTR